MFNLLLGFIIGGIIGFFLAAILCAGSDRGGMNLKQW